MTRRDAESTTARNQTRSVKLVGTSDRDEFGALKGLLTVVDNQGMTSSSQG